MRRRELLRRQAIAPTEYARHRGTAGCDGFSKRRHDVLIEGLAGGARLFRAIEDGDCGRGRGEGVDEVVDRERPEQVDLQDSQLCAAVVEIFNGFACGLDTRAHQHDHAVRIGRPEVVEQPVVTAGACGEPVHCRLHHRWKRRVEPVHGLAGLKVHVGILRHAAHDRAIGVERPATVREHEFVVNHRPHVIVREDFNLADFVGGPETVEEVHERNPRGQGGALRDEREVVRFLHRARTEHSPAGHPRRHHVGVVAED